MKLYQKQVYKLMVHKDGGKKDILNKKNKKLTLRVHPMLWDHKINQFHQTTKIKYLFQSKLQVEFKPLQDNLIITIILQHPFLQTICRNKNLFNTKLLIKKILNKSTIRDMRKDSIWPINYFQE